MAFTAIRRRNSWISGWNTRIRKTYCSIDGCYLPFGGYQFKIKQFTVSILEPCWEKGQSFEEGLRGSKQVKNFEMFWINNNKTIIEFALAFVWCEELCRSRRMFSIQLGVQPRWMIIILLDLHNSSHSFQPHSIIV